MGLSQQEPRRTYRLWAWVMSRRAGIQTEETNRSTTGKLSVAFLVLFQGIDSKQTALTGDFKMIRRPFVFLLLSLLTVAAYADERWTAVRGFEEARKGALETRQSMEAFSNNAPAEVESCFRLIDEFLVRVARLEVGVLRAKPGTPDPAIEKELKACLGMANEIQARGIRVVQALGRSVPKSPKDIDSWVDAEVEKNWRPMPGGNSKEEAARVTKRILRAKSFEDLDRIMEDESRAGNKSP